MSSRLLSRRPTARRRPSSSQRRHRFSGVARSRSRLSSVTRRAPRRFFHASRSPFGLSQETKDIVKATAPVLAEHGYAITKAMYGKMLTENPHFRTLFNLTHQVELPGDAHAKQPHALACSVHAYAANIDNLEVLAQAVERIAEKHVSLHILPEHYPIVGENVLWAIKDVLGDAATPEIMNAWEEAYGALAEILINREREMREGRANEDGGWEGWRDFVVADKVKESAEISSFYLKPRDEGKIYNHKPGQYVALRLETPEWTVQRNYTLSSNQSDEQYRISVKKHGPLVEGAPPGQASTYLHEHVGPGDVLKLGIPCGDFVIDANHDKPIVLISGGVGITPTVSMLEYLIESKVPNNIIMVNSARNPEVEAMHDTLARYRRKHLNLIIKTVYDSGSEEYPQGPVSMDHLNQVLVTKDCHYYLCGPPPMLASLYNGLKDAGVPEEQIHYEYFGSFEDISS